MMNCAQLQAPLLGIAPPHSLRSFRDTVGRVGSAWGQRSGREMESDRVSAGEREGGREKKGAWLREDVEGEEDGRVRIKVDNQHLRGSIHGRIEP